MRRLLESGGRALPHVAPVLELNPDHALVRAARQETDKDRFADIACLLLDQAYLSEGTLPSDPVGFVQVMNRLLAGASSVAASADQGDGASLAAGNADDAKATGAQERAAE